MIAFDSDVLSDIWAGRQDYVLRATLIPYGEQSIPIVIAEEMLRGRFDVIRKSESGKLSLDLTRVYELFEQTLSLVRSYRVLTYSPAAHALAMAWKASKLKIGTHDLRIAAIAVIHGATLVTRNKRDFDQIPGFTLAVWP